MSQRVLPPTELARKPEMTPEQAIAALSLGKGETRRELTQAEEALLEKCKILQAQQHVEKYGRSKKSRGEIEFELESHPAFVKFKDEVKSAGRIRPSLVPKLLRIVDELISKEYKLALQESLQRRAKDPAGVVQAVREEAMRKLLHDEDTFFDEGGKHRDFTTEELRERLDEVQKTKSAHHIAAEAQPARPLPQPKVKDRGNSDG